MFGLRRILASKKRNLPSSPKASTFNQHRSSQQLHYGTTFEWWPRADVGHLFSNRDPLDCHAQLDQRPNLVSGPPST